MMESQGLSPFWVGTVWYMHHIYGIIQFGPQTGIVPVEGTCKNPHKGLWWFPLVPISTEWYQPKNQNQDNVTFLKYSIYSVWISPFRFCKLSSNSVHFFSNLIGKTQLMFRPFKRQTQCHIICCQMKKALTIQKWNWWTSGFYPFQSLPLTFFNVNRDRKFFTFFNTER